MLDGLNRYAYCHNNPVNRIDPTGHEDEITLDDSWEKEETNKQVERWEHVYKDDSDSGGGTGASGGGGTPPADNSSSEPTFWDWLRGLFSADPIPAAVDLNSGTLGPAFDDGTAWFMPEQSFWDNLLHGPTVYRINPGTGEVIEEVQFIVGFPPAASPGPISGTGIAGYTRHGLNQAISRDGVGVSVNAILDAVKNPVDVVPQARGAVQYVGQNAVVVLNSAGRVITTWARNSLGWRIRP